MHFELDLNKHNKQILIKIYSYALTRKIRNIFYFHRALLFYWDGESNDRNN